MLKNILLLTTGGTISMSEDHATGTVAPTSENPLGTSNQLFHSLAEITIEEIYHLPSPHMTELEMLTLKNRVIQAVKEEYDGVVITHGTDTLEETAYFLELTIDVPIPVVITGAMRSTNEIGSDGLANLRSAIVVACSSQTVDKGVVVVMNDEVHAATFVTKTHTTNLATFQTPTFGPIGLVSKSEVLYFQNFLKREHYAITTVHKKVVLLKAYAGMSGDIIDAVGKLEIDGLVIEALGTGNLPPQTVEAIHRLLYREIPVVFVSRAFNGVTQDVYDYEGGGKQFRQDGVIFTTGLSGQKARIKLAVLLNAHIPANELAVYFE